MKNSKKVLSGVLAVLMLVSMLACFVLPATAEETQTNYYVSTENEWTELAAEINNSDDGWAGKTIHIQNDISFSTKKTYNDTTYTVCTIPTQITKFAGTLDGHGYKFSGINVTTAAVVDLTKNTGTGIISEVYNTTTGTALIGTLTGTIQDLTLDSTCVFDAGSTASFGPFALTSEGGTIQKCASYATCTSEADSATVGGFVGKVNDVNNFTIDGCIFDGTISNARGTANAFVGTPVTGAPLNINNSVARGAFTAAEIGTDADRFNNTYAVLAEGSLYGDSADRTKTDLNEAVWTINEAIDAAKAADPTMDLNYLNVDSSGIPCFGDANNRVVKLTKIDGDSTEVSYHEPRVVINSNTSGQNQIKANRSGKTAKVEGAEYHDNYIYVGSSDITLTYVAVKKEYAYVDYSEAKAQLQTLADAYRQMGAAYFTEWAPVRAWLVNADAALAVTIDTTISDSLTDAERTTRINEITLDETYYRDRLLACIAAEEELEGYLVAMTEPEDYPSIQKYEIYKYVDSIKDYKIENAADWKEAVRLSNHVENPDAVDFAGVTLHLAADIDMGKEEMLPLCYGWFFDGNLDGHDHVFKNINMNIDSPYGPVGLIGVLGKTAARTVQNVGIASGNITVTGWPRFKSALMSISDSTNIVGGIVGKNCTQDSLIRKCWNNADISVENGENVAGIIGNPRTYGIIDSCFNLGQTTAFGLHGYGYQNAKVSNSMSGPVQTSAVDYRARINQEAYGATKNNIINISGVRSTLNFSVYDNKAADQVFENDYNEKHSEFSNAAAAWKVNANYADQGYGERVYYTLNDDGEVRFGKADGSDQICRIELICDGYPTRYAYGVAGKSIPLSFDIEANYYACDIDGVTIDKENKLIFSKEAIEEDKSFTVYVGYNADRGNVIVDNAINVLDVLDVVRMAANKKDKNLLTADVDSDHDVDVNDAYQIIRYVFGDQEKACFTPGNTAEKESDYLKVLSYNVKGLYYDPNSANNSIGAPLSRKDAVLAELEAADADIMGFQELIAGHKEYTDGKNALEEIYSGLSWTKSLDKDEHMDYVALRNYTGGGTAGIGIISKYPILESKTEYFNGLGQIGDDTKRLDDTSGSPRGFTWYKINVNGKEGYQQGEDIIYYNCHLAIVSDEVAAAEIQYMVQYMNNYHSGDRVVCAGDFNLGAYKVEKVITNTKITALNGGERFNTYIATNAHSGSMIDNILINDNVEYFKSAENKFSTTTGLNTRATLYDTDQKVTTDETVGWAASDHLPIWAYIKK